MTSKEVRSRVGVEWDVCVWWGGCVAGWGRSEAARSFFIPRVTCSSDTVQDGSQWPELPTQGTPFSPFLILLPIGIYLFPLDHG